MTSLYSSKPYQGADKSLTRPTSQCILFDGENISFDASLVRYIIYIYIYITNISPIIIINRIFFFYWRYNPLWVCILQPSSGL